MALRRLAQSNNAAASSPSTPPVTPRPTTTRQSIGIHHSPASTPSISSSIPFDWEAARLRRPPPYATPARNGSRLSRGGATSTGTPARKAIVRKKSFAEKIKSIPSRIAFEIALFPHNVPLPTPKHLAYVLGGVLHFVHMCVRISQSRSVRSSDLEWNEMMRDSEGRSWFDWTTPMTVLLLAVSVMDTVYAFSRIKLYRLHRRPDPVSSPNAKFVSSDLNFEPLEPPPLMTRLCSGLWHACLSFWRFLLGLKAPQSNTVPRKSSRVQQLEVWTPGELELSLFTIYSPAHSLMWIGTGSANWIIMLFLMGIVGLQLNVTIKYYADLIRDKEILAAEVMNEYNEGFVYPRLNPIRKDVAIMTHQSEVVNVWED
ncbi:hypothetical protein E1B28_008818 [Marasmius oreades]|uniref:Nuclear rim protein 1 n=1 Tax=Marasmius oreades TaxID=181124 RepID=A0A9P7S0E0_9AGAR|nr:uncharacterized protein E1B28_008818 [Marasmius oreades]KAG7092466.1 hypothetical protein E1B28_008818 [Marasmius oreades]